MNNVHICFIIFFCNISIYIRVLYINTLESFDKIVTDLSQIIQNKGPQRKFCLKTFVALNSSNYNAVGWITFLFSILNPILRLQYIINLLNPSLLGSNLALMGLQFLKFGRIVAPFCSELTVLGNFGKYNLNDTTYYVRRVETSATPLP